MKKLSHLCILVSSAALLLGWSQWFCVLPALERPVHFHLNFSVSKGNSTCCCSGWNEVSCAVQPCSGNVHLVIVAIPMKVIQVSSRAVVLIPLVHLRVDK